MLLRTINEVDRINLSKFVYNHPHGNIFQTPEMFDVYVKTRYYEPIFLILVDSSNEILGSLLGVIQKESKAPYGFFTSRTIIWGGPLAKNNDEEILFQLINGIIQKTRKKSIYIQFRNLWDTSHLIKSFERSRFKYINHSDIIFNLNDTEENLFANVHKGRRKNINRARRYGFIMHEITDSKDFNEALGLIKNTYQRIHLPFPDDSFFQSSYKLLVKSNYARFFVLKKDKKIISARFILTYKDLVYDWFAGTSPQYLDKYPNDLFPWQLIKWSKKNGFKLFDFGGIGNPKRSYGVRDFKMKFGGEVINFGRYERVYNKPIMLFGKLALSFLKCIK